MRKKIVASIVAMAMLITLAPVGNTAGITYNVWSEWSETNPSGLIEGAVVQEKTQYRYKLWIKAESTTSDTMEGYTLYDTTSTTGEWSDWQDTSIPEIDTVSLKREVESRDATCYIYGHYCTGHVTGASYQTSPTNNTTNDIFNENCVYHEIGEFAFDDSQILQISGDAYEYYKNGSTKKYLCANTCYKFFRMRETSKTQYRSRDITFKYLFRKEGDWTDWEAPAPNSYSEREQRTVYRYMIPAKNTQTIIAADKTIAINSKPVSLDVKTDGNGNLTYSSSDNSIAMVSSTGVVTPKGYGTATITIKAAETSAYKPNSKEITVTVVPKEMTIKKAKASGKKTMLITWKKDKTISGYQVMLSTKKNFKKPEISKYIKAKLTKKKITGLKSKTWYVRIRSYKKVQGKKLYGTWSKAKRVKIK